MCNFIVRPIKSYATVNVVVEHDEVVVIERGTAVTVLESGYDPIGNQLGVTVKHGENELIIPYEVFVHSFTADPADIAKVKEEESKWFPKKEKKD